MLRCIQQKSRRHAGKWTVHSEECGRNLNCGDVPRWGGQHEQERWFSREEDGVEMQWKTVSFEASTACRSQHFPGDTTRARQNFPWITFLVSQLLDISHNVCTIFRRLMPVGRLCVYYTWRIGVNKGGKIAPRKTIDERIKANLLRWHDVCGIHLWIRSGIDHARLHPALYTAFRINTSDAPRFVFARYIGLHAVQ